MANDKLKEKAATLGANVVFPVRYGKRCVSLLSWLIIEERSCGTFND